FTDYTYTAGGNPAMTTPPPGSALSGTAVTFGWSAGSSVSQYWLQVGTTPGGHDLYTQSAGTNLSAIVNGLAGDRSTLDVRLWWLLGSSCLFNANDYTATGGARPMLTTPAPESALTGNSVTFGWTAGRGVSQYWLWVGTTAGGHDLYTQSAGTNLSAMVNG